MKLITSLLIASIILVSCHGNKPVENMLINSGNFDLIRTKTEVKTCERIQRSVLDDINPRYLITTTDSMAIKSYYAVSPGDSITVSVYKRRRGVK